jgi:hypothetical protein
MIYGRFVMRTVMCIGAVVLLMICPIDMYAAPATSMKGRVIAVDENGIMVKRGSREMSFVIDGNTVVISKTDNGSADQSFAIELCQIVRVVYEKKEGKTSAKKIEILERSDCVIP